MGTKTGQQSLIIVTPTNTTLSTLVTGNRSCVAIGWPRISPMVPLPACIPYRCRAMPFWRYCSVVPASSHAPFRQMRLCLFELQSTLSLVLAVLAATWPGWVPHGSRWWSKLAREGIVRANSAEIWLTRNPLIPPTQCTGWQDQSLIIPIVHSWRQLHQHAFDQHSFGGEILSPFPPPPPTPSPFHLPRTSERLSTVKLL